MLTHINWVASFPALGLFAGSSEVAVVAGALERLVDAAAELAVGPLLADGAVGATPARVAARTRASPEYYVVIEGVSSSIVVYCGFND